MVLTFCQPMTRRWPLISLVFTADWATAEQGWGGSYFQRVWPKQGELDKVLPFCLMPEFPKNSLELVYFLPSKDNKLSYKEFCVMMNRKRRPSTSGSREARLYINKCTSITLLSFVREFWSSKSTVDWLNFNKGYIRTRKSALHTSLVCSNFGGIYLMYWVITWFTVLTLFIHLFLLQFWIIPFEFTAVDGMAHLGISERIQADTHYS